MKKIVSVILIFAVVLLFETGAVGAAATEGASKEVHKKTVVTDLSEYNNTDILVLHENGDLEVKSFENEMELAANIAKAGISSDVEIVQPDYIYEGNGISKDTYSEYQWGLYNDGSEALSTYLSKYEKDGQVNVTEGIDVNIIPAWKICETGKNAETIIALIDTGVEISHPDFKKDSFWINKEEIPQNGVDDDNNGYIDDINGWNFYDDRANVAYGTDNPHGTHVAGILIAEKDNGEGVAGLTAGSNVKIMVLKTLGGDKQSGRTSHIVRAIRYASEKGAAICNLSMGTFNYDSLLYKEMSESDMLFVVSAGNGSANCDEKPAYPGNYDLENIISVASIMPDGTISEQSNYGGNSIEIAAPGSYIVSTGQKGKYSVMTGTSMAAPHVSAVAAMIHSFNPDLSSTEIRSIILETARKIPQLEGKVMTGLVDAGMALERASMPLVDIKPGSPYYSAVSYMFKNGYMIGTSPTTFSPNDNLTRAMVITVLGRMAGAEQEDTDDYTDVENGSWYSGYVGWANKKGIVIGYGDGRFGPYDKVKAYQLDLMISRFSKSMGFDYSTNLEGENYLTRAETAQALYDFSMFLEENSEKQADEEEK